MDPRDIPVAAIKAQIRLRTKAVASKVMAAVIRMDPIRILAMIPMAPGVLMIPLAMIRAVAMMVGTAPTASKNPESAISMDRQDTEAIITNTDPLVNRYTAVAATIMPRLAARLMGLEMTSIGRLAVWHTTVAKPHMVPLAARNMVPAKPSIDPRVVRNMIVAEMTMDRLVANNTVVAITNMDHPADRTTVVPASTHQVVRITVAGTADMKNLAGKSTMTLADSMVKTAMTMAPGAADTEVVTVMVHVASRTVTRALTVVLVPTTILHMDRVDTSLRTAGVKMMNPAVMAMEADTSAAIRRTAAMGAEVILKKPPDIIPAMAAAMTMKPSALKDYISPRTITPEVEDLLQNDMKVIIR